MMGAVRAWLTSVVAVTLLLTVAQTLIPQGAVRKIAGFTGGLILLAALLQPVLQTERGGLRLEFDGYADAVAQRRAELESAEEETMAALIAEGAEAYISDKAAELGLEVTVRVRTEPGEGGTPVPGAAEVRGPRSEALASYMEEELGIPRERQVWNES